MGTFRTFFLLDWITLSIWYINRNQKSYHHHHSSCLRQVSHLALIISLHSVLFLATCAASPQLPQANWFRSSTNLDYISFGLPHFLLPGDRHVSAILAPSVLSFLKTCPIHCHRWCLIRSVAAGVSITLWRSAFYIGSVSKFDNFWPKYLSYSPQTPVTKSIYPVSIPFVDFPELFSVHRSK